MAFVPLVCASGIESLWSTTGPLGPREVPAVVNIEAAAGAPAVCQPYCMKHCGHWVNDEVITLLFLCSLSFSQLLFRWLFQAS